MVTSKRAPKSGNVELSSSSAVQMPGEIMTARIRVLASKRSLSVVPRGRTKEGGTRYAIPPSRLQTKPDIGVVEREKGARSPNASGLRMLREFCRAE